MKFLSLFRYLKFSAATRESNEKNEHHDIQRVYFKYFKRRFRKQLRKILRIFSELPPRLRAQYSR